MTGKERQPRLDLGLAFEIVEHYHERWFWTIVDNATGERIAIGGLCDSESEARLQVERIMQGAGSGTVGPALKSLPNGVSESLMWALAPNLAAAMFRKAREPSFPHISSDIKMEMTRPESRSDDMEDSPTLRDAKLAGLCELAYANWRVTESDPCTEGEWQSVTDAQMDTVPIELRSAVERSRSEVWAASASMEAAGFALEAADIAYGSVQAAVLALELPPDPLSNDVILAGMHARVALRRYALAWARLLGATRQLAESQNAVAHHFGLPPRMGLDRLEAAEAAVRLHHPLPSSDSSAD